MRLRLAEATGKKVQGIGGILCPENHRRARRGKDQAIKRLDADDLFLLF